MHHAFGRRTRGAASCCIAALVLSGAVSLNACGGSAAQGSSDHVGGASGNPSVGGTSGSSDRSSTSLAGSREQVGGTRNTGDTGTATNGLGGSPTTGGKANNTVGGTRAGSNGTVATIGGAAPGGATAAGAAAAVEPVDTRPARPAWTPEFTTALGAPGWQQSTQPICESNEGMDADFGVWADTRGVYTLMAALCNEFAGYSCGKDGASIKVNSGSGWQLVYQYASGTIRGGTLLSGFPGGPLLVVGTFGGQSGLAFVDKGSSTFQKESVGTSAFVASKDLAYVINATTLFKYSAGSWSTLGTSTSTLYSVWADEQTVIAVGGDQTVLVKTGSGELTQMNGVPAGGYTNVWAFGANDIWLSGTGAQLVHFDGSRWTVIPTGTGGSVGRMWGVSGMLYFLTRSEIGRWNGTSIDILLAAPAGTDLSSYPIRFESIWGRSANEVFVTLRDSRYQKYACGNAFMLWFDGTQFHQM